ncbi:MAG: hypothetical protein R2699_07500 [Acidimicrobiales bacterium]|nr:hypothetical protein [Acidimicrobiales bacterium]MCB1259792.1 hypothetical protein [Acidimicrobiales bacterium]
MTAPIAVATRSWRWHLERAAAVLLVVLVPVHVASALVWTDPASWSGARLAVRWASPGWRVLDTATLALALVHGLGSLRRRAPDAGRGRVARVAVDVVLALALVTTLAAALTYRLV